MAPARATSLFRYCSRVLLLTSFALQSCSRHTDVVVAVPLTAAGDPMLTEHVGLEEAAARHHLQVDWNGPGERDVEWQVQRIQSAIHEGAYGIAVTPFSRFGLTTSIREALAADIPVAIIGSPLPLAPSPHLFFAVEDTVEGATLLQRQLARLLRRDARVAIFGMDQLSNGNEARAAALEAALAKHSPAMQIAARVPGPINSGYLDIAAQELLRAHPEVDAIVALSASAGVSAARAIRHAGLEHRVHLLSYDMTLEMMLLLRHGEADAVLVQDLRGMGSQAVEDILAVRSGGRCANVRSFAPLLVTRDNIDTEAVQQTMQLHWVPR